MGSFRPPIVADIERRLWDVVWSGVQGGNLLTHLRNALSDILASLSFAEATLPVPWIRIGVSHRVLLPNPTHAIAVPAPPLELLSPEVQPSFMPTPAASPVASPPASEPSLDSVGGQRRVDLPQIGRAHV